MVRLYDYIENIYAYVYDPFINKIIEYPKVDVVVETIKDKDHTIINAFLSGDDIDGDRLIKHRIFGSEGTVLKDTQSLNYTVWFKDPNPREAMRLIYEQLRKETEESIQDIERRLDRRKQQLLNYEKKLAELN